MYIVELSLIDEPHNCSEQHSNQRKDLISSVLPGTWRQRSFLGNMVWTVSSTILYNNDFKMVCTKISYIFLDVDQSMMSKV